MWTPFSARAAAAPPSPPQPPGAYPWQHLSAARLRDGALIVLRPIHPDDRDRERRFLNGLSTQTRYRRLMATRKLLPGELDRLVNIDHRRELALVALADAGGVDAAPSAFAAVGRYVRDAADPLQAEFAIVVADAWQGRGLGETLLRQLVAAARSDGLERLTGSTLSDNAPLLGLARKLGFQTWREPGDATVTQLGRALREGRSGLDRIDAGLLWAELEARA